MKRRDWLATLAVTGTAGCLRFATGDGDSTPSATPVDPGGTAGSPAASSPASGGTQAPGGTANEPTEPPADVSPEDYPTGLSDDGVSMLLLDKHVNELAGTSYTVNHELLDVGESSLRTDQELAVEGQLALFEQRAWGGEQFIEITPGWYDPVVWRTTGTRTPIYGDLEICCIGNATALAYAKRGHGGSQQYLFWALKSGDYGSPVPRDGGSFFEISADAVTDPNPVLNRFDADRVERFAAEGEVTASGVVRDLGVTVEYVRGDRLTQVEATFAVTGIGATTVSAPEWVETARSRAPDLSVSVRDDRLGIEYVHEGGDPVIDSTRVGIHLHEDEALTAGPEMVALDGPFEAGETLVAYVDGDRVAHARGSLPEGADPVELPAEGWTDLHPPDSVAPYFKKNIEDL